LCHHNVVVVVGRSSQERCVVVAAETACLAQSAAAASCALRPLRILVVHAGGLACQLPRGDIVIRACPSPSGPARAGPGGAGPLRWWSADDREPAGIKAAAARTIYVPDGRRRRRPATVPPGLARLSSREPRRTSGRRGCAFFSAEAASNHNSKIFSY